MSKDQQIEEHWKRFSPESSFSAYQTLYKLFGEEAIETAFERNEFFAGKSIKMLELIDEKKGTGNLEAICQELSDLIPKETLSQSFSNKSRDTIIALSLIKELGKDQSGGLSLTKIYQTMDSCFKEVAEDFVQSPVDCVLGFCYALDNTEELCCYLNKSNLTIRPSELFSLPYEQYPDLKKFKVPEKIKSLVDQTYLFYHRNKNGLDRPLNIIDDIVEQDHRFIVNDHSWSEMGEVNWLGVRLWKQCPQRCIYCDVPEDKDFLPSDILMEKTAHVIEEITNNGNRKGILLSISGGEPTLFGGRYEELRSISSKRHRNKMLEKNDVKNLISLIQYAKQQGMFVTMNTTLVPIGKDTQSQRNSRGRRLAEDLVNSGVDQLNVSLEACTPETHDATTRMPHSWDYTKLGIRMIEVYEKRLRREVKLSINHVVTRKNFRDLPKLIEYVGRSLPGVDDFNPLPIKEECNKHLFLTREDIEEYRNDILPKIISMAEKFGYNLLRIKSQQIFGTNDQEKLLATSGIYYDWPQNLPCYTARVSAYIDYAGRISPCSYNADAKLKEYVLGNITEIPKWSFKEIRNRQLDFINKLPCGKLCDEHCGPDLLRLNKRVRMNILGK